MLPVGNVFPGKQEMQQFSSFSGSDIICTIGNVVFGELQSIAYSVEREIAPIYTTGSPNLRAYSRGKRGITGTLVFQLFDKDSLMDALFRAMNEENINVNMVIANMLLSERERHSVEAWNKAMEEVLQGQEYLDPEALFKAVGRHRIRYLDQIPPFNITITGRNELGLDTSLRLIGVQLMSEASGISVDDVTLEKACAFIAQEVVPWGYDKLTKLNTEVRVGGGGGAQTNR